MKKVSLLCCFALLVVSCNSGLIEHDTIYLYNGTDEVVGYSYGSNISIYSLHPHGKTIHWIHIDHPPVELKGEYLLSRVEVVEIRENSHTVKYYFKYLK